jgi:5-methylcytosine-specific restriction endonuclease McrA
MSNKSKVHYKNNSSIILTRIKNRELDDPTLAIRRKSLHALANHRRQGHIVNVTTDELINLFNTTTHCSLCGVKLCRGDELSYNKSSPSLDRINNETELNIKNIWIICTNCNATKRDRTLAEFYDYCETVLHRRKDNV